MFTEEEKLALTKVQESFKYENGRRRVAIPLRDDKPGLPDTKPMALFCLQSTEENLKKDDQVANEYQATIEAYVKKDYLGKVPPDDQTPVNIWYLTNRPLK